MTTVESAPGGPRHPAPAVPRPRRRAAWIAAAVAVPLVLMVFTLTKGVLEPRGPVRSPLDGKPAPTIEATNIDGLPVSIQAWRGRWVLVNMFATWCVPCQQEHDDLVRFTDRHRLLGDVAMVQVIYSDTTEAVRDFRSEHGGTWPIVTDPDKRIANSYGVTGVPETFLIDPDGIVVTKLIGGVTDDGLERLLQQVSAGPAR